MRWQSVGGTLKLGLAGVALATLVGCGGSGGGTGDQTLTFGPLTTRIAGTVQPPVTGGEKGVVVTGVAGGNITAMTLQDTSPKMSETAIAFSSFRDGNYEIYIAGSDGSDPVRITKNSAADTFPDWSPDGSKLVFSSSRDGNLEIYSMNADGSSQTRLTSNAADDQTPRWSPDGTKIVFSSTRSGNSEIYVMNADGTNLIRLTNNAATDGYPCWSPDGARIAFQSDRDGNDEIYVMNADGTGQTRLTSVAGPDMRPAWSPDGTKIVFVSGRDGSDEIYVMDTSGLGQTRLTTNTVSDDLPGWSPDGAKITFTSQRDGNSEIYVMNADGTNQIRLTTNSVEDITSSWSPLQLKRTLVGPGGSMGANASGFLFGQAFSEFRSLVTFDATTRTAARVRAQTSPGLGLPNVVFSVSADNLTALSYINFTDTLPKATNVIGAGAPVASATDAIVSFDASNGRVASVLPYISNRSASTLEIVDGTYVARGHFPAVFDGKGRNRAPNGAVEVQLSALTGEILSLK